MVANSYLQIHNYSQPEIVDLLALGFTGTLHNQWTKHLSKASKDHIRYALKINEDNENITDEYDCVNTLLVTIIKHFIGTPTAITERIHNQLTNLHCPNLSDFDWYVKNLLKEL